MLIREHLAEYTKEELLNQAVQERNIKSAVEKTSRNKHRTLLP